MVWKHTARSQKHLDFSRNSPEKKINQDFGVWNLMKSRWFQQRKGRRGSLPGKTSRKSVDFHELSCADQPRLKIRGPKNNRKSTISRETWIEMFPMPIPFDLPIPRFLYVKNMLNWQRLFLLNRKRWQLLHISYSAKGTWNKHLNFIFPIKYVIRKSLVRLACLAESDLEDFRYHTSKPFFFRHLDLLYVRPAPENCPLLSGHLPFGLGLHLKLGKTPMFFLFFFWGGVRASVYTY